MEKILFGTIFGLVIGSAINAITYRWPKGLSMWNPKRSFCPKCNKTLTWSELIPVFSFLIQGGKCRSCQSKISLRYPLGELGHGLLWGFCAVYFSEWREIIGWSSFCSLCWIVFWTDLENFWIPDEIVALLLFLGILMNGVNCFLGAGLGLFLTGIMGVLGLVLFKQDSIGHGDIKLMRGIGACLLFNKALIAFFLAVFLGAFIGTLFRTFNKNNQEKNIEISSPEGLGYYFRCFIGYLIGIDILALFIPKVGHVWFGAEEQLENHSIPSSAIPFGSFLILGGYGSLFFQPQIEGLWNRYLEWVTKTV